MKWIIAVVALAGLFVANTPVSAHVLISDTTKTKGLIIHVMPDDDPIAGQPSELYLDIQELPSDAKVTLRVTDPEQKTVDVPVKSERGLSSTAYTFPAQGAYELTITAKTANQSYVFHHTQRVSRGVITTDYHAPGWTEIVLTTCITLFIILSSLAINYRDLIKKHSRF